MTVQRIDKLIASAGMYSRSEVKQLIKEGKISAKGQRVRKPDEKYDPDCDEILICGEKLQYQEYFYFMLNKPAGVITATEDSSAQTVLDLLPSQYKKLSLFPVGRLDKDTEGLLLITNNGELAHRLLAPKKHVDKVYYVRVDGALTAQDCLSFQKGVTLADGYTCLPAILDLIPDHPVEAYVTIREGKYHQIKRMLASLGKPVLYLKRLQMGPLHLDEHLEPGQFRELTAEEHTDLLSLL